MHFKRCEGFTLIEVSVALLIFLVGVVGLLQLTVTAVSIDRLAGDKSIATNLAQMKADELLSSNWIGSNMPATLNAGGNIPSIAFKNPLATPNPTPANGYVSYYDANGTATTSASKYYFVLQWKVSDCNGTSCGNTACPSTPCQTKRIDVVCTALSKAFGRSYPAVTITVYKSEIN